MSAITIRLSEDGHPGSVPYNSTKNLFETLDYVPVLSLGTNTMHLIAKVFCMSQCTKNYRKYLKEKSIKQIFLHAVPFGKILEKTIQLIIYVYESVKFRYLCKKLTEKKSFEGNSSEAYKLACSNFSPYFAEILQIDEFLKFVSKYYKDASCVYSPYFEMLKKIKTAHEFSSVKLHPRLRELLHQNQIKHFPEDKKVCQLEDILLEQGWKIKNADRSLTFKYDDVLALGVKRETFSSFIQSVEALEIAIEKGCLDNFSSLEKEIYLEYTFKSLVCDLELDIWKEKLNPQNTTFRKMGLMNTLIKELFILKREMKLFEIKKRIYPAQISLLPGLSFQQTSKAIALKRIEILKENLQKATSLL